MPRVGTGMADTATAMGITTITAMRTHHATAAPAAKSKLASIPIAAAPAAPHVHGPGCGHSH